jgi:flagellar basal-body rod protein FlgB
MNILNNRSIQLLEHALNAASMRQNALTQNIANAETPGYKRMDVRFEAELQRAIRSNAGSTFEGKQTNPKHMQLGRSSLHTIHPITIREGGFSMNAFQNNVDMEYEMAEMSKNALRYQVLTQHAGMTAYKIAINGGR